MHPGTSPIAIPHLRTGAFLKDQEFISGGSKLPHSARKKRITGHEGHDFSRSPGKGGMPGYITGKRRCNKRRPLIGPPVAGQYPSHSGLVGFFISRYNPVPLQAYNLILPTFSSSGPASGSPWRYLFNESGNQRNAIFVITGQFGVRTLPRLSHMPDG